MHCARPEVKVLARHYCGIFLDTPRGNFIKPALSMGLFSQVEMIDTSAAFEKPLPDEFVLDIDIDIFATSPYFMNQHDAIYITRELLESL